MSKTIRRMLKRALDAEQFRIITSDELLAMPAEAYQQIRRGVTIGVKTGAPRYLCSLCGHPVYAPNYSTGPGWKHFGREPIDCEWWTGTGSSVDEVSARQFQGQQESPLHNKVKNLVADLLRADGRIADVVVDEVLHGSTGYKKPDVRAEFDDRPIAVELQLSTTQIPVIVERELFYRQEGRHLLWLTWDFEPRPYAGVRQAFRDIATAHHENLFTLDAEAIAESRRRNCLVFRVLWWLDEACHDKLVTLDDLVWSDTGLPFAVPRAQPIIPPPSPIIPRPVTAEKRPSVAIPRVPVLTARWAEKFKRRWEEAAEERSSWELVGDDLWPELLDVVGVTGLRYDRETASVVIDVLNLALSLECGQPVGSRQANLVELLTTFLSAERRHPYAVLAERLAAASGRAGLLERPAIKKKIEAAKLVKQVGGSSEAVKILKALFPYWVKPKDAVEIETVPADAPSSSAMAADDATDNPPQA
jgi:hypothetical protein